MAIDSLVGFAIMGLLTCALYLLIEQPSMQLRSHPAVLRVIRFVSASSTRLSPQKGTNAPGIHNSRIQTTKASIVQAIRFPKPRHPERAQRVEGPAVVFRCPIHTFWVPHVPILGQGKARTCPHNHCHPERWRSKDLRLSSVTAIRTEPGAPSKARFR